MKLNFSNPKNLQRKYYKMTSYLSKGPILSNVVADIFMKILERVSMSLHIENLKI